MSKALDMLSLQADVSDALERIKRRNFTPQVRVTLIARLPGDPEADLVVTLDSLDELSKVIERTRRREGQQ